MTIVEILNSYTPPPGSGDMLKSFFVSGIIALCVYHFVSFFLDSRSDNADQASESEA